MEHEPWGERQYCALFCSESYFALNFPFDNPQCAAHCTNIKIASNQLRAQITNVCIEQEFRCAID